MGSQHYEPTPEGGTVEGERVEDLAVELREVREELAAEREVRRADVARLETRLDELSSRIDDLESTLRGELDAVSAVAEENSRWRRSVEGAFAGVRERSGDEAVARDEV